ncbi:MAG: hypothetical protein GWP05_05330 [Anaerolineaceae bacterium]|nr:hypothetical protein [Anaerolineaceae bacterium]
MDKKLLAEFADPPSEYRGATFWAWNGKLDPEELRRQIRIMQRMGLGGFFMHSRVGLDTAYLGDQWMKCVAACIDEADKLDLRAWLYDEDRWPSGAAGGLVTRNPKYRQKRVLIGRYDKASDFKWSADVLVAYTAFIRGKLAFEVRRLARGKKPARLADGQSIIAFRAETAKGQSWYNGYTYLDTMSHEAVREFIKVTHEAYRKKFGDKFGRRVPGIFTDEPHHHGYGRGVFGDAESCLPWTDKLPSVFKKRYGYDILDRLVELYYDRGDGKPATARYHYHDCTTHLFVDAFARQIGQWCERNNLLHTGHVLLEGTLASQTMMVGSCMRFYEHMQAPGMDLLTEHSREYDTAKQVSSAARQFGRRWRLTETYGCTGWDFNFAGHKALGDWQAALGINLRCQHLSWYTMAGQAKRDYPAGIFHQSPWWEQYARVEDYFGRVNVAMSRGREVRDLLVVHPVESMWLLFGGANESRQKSLQKSFWRLRDSLLEANLDFDYGDEEILARHSRVPGKAGQPLLRVGQAEYRAVVVPPMLTIRRTTLDLLRKFRRAGGTVVFAGPAPQLVDAEISSEAVSLAAECARAPSRGAPLVAALEPVARRVSITDSEGRQIGPALYCLREDREAWYLFVCNTGHDHFGRREDDPPVRDRKLSFPEVLIRVTGDGRGQPLEVDCDSGRTFTADGRPTGEGWEIRTSLCALGSRLFVLGKRAAGKKYPKRKKLKEVRSRTLGAKRWDIVLSEPNVLVLDRPQYRIGGGRRRKAEDILFVDRAVREALGIARRGGHMTQPWAQHKPARPKRIAVGLEYVFDVKALPSGALHLAIEQPQTFTIQLNGQPVSTDAECGWWVDRSLRQVPLDPAALRIGENRLALVCDYDELHPGLEIVYLLGNFGVKASGPEVTMTAAPASLKIGDWTRQGLAFYSGSVCYTRRVRPELGRGEHLIVQTPEFRGTAVRILVDGQPAGVIAWPPHEVEVTDLVGQAGGEPVTLGIEVLGHRRNSHGPLHLNEKWPSWTGSGQFVDRDNWYEGYQLVPCGLMAPPELVVRK